MIWTILRLFLNIAVIVISICYLMEGMRQNGLGNTLEAIYQLLLSVIFLILALGYEVRSVYDQKA